MDYNTPGFPVLHQLPELAQTQVHYSVMLSNHLILCHPLLLLPSIFPSISIFSSESVLHIRWPNYWSSASATVLPMNIQDWFPLALISQSTGLSTLLQHQSSKASILWHSAFFMVQISHSHMTTGKTITLTRRTFVSKVMSLLFNMLCRLVIAFLQRSKCLSISWLQSLPAVILEPPKMMSVTVSIVFPIYLPWNDGTGCHDLRFLNVEL